MTARRPAIPRMRGGLAIRARATAPAPLSGEQQPPAVASGAGAQGDRLSDSRGDFRRVRWTLAYLGFLLYIAGATTQRLVIGDVAVGAALLGLLFEENQRFPPLVLWLAALVAWSALGFVTSSYPEAIADPLLVLLKLTVILFVAVNCVRTRSQIRFLMVLWLACYALYPVRGALLNYFVIHETWFGRAIWNRMYSNPNDLAAITLLQFSVAAALLVGESKGWIRRAALIGLPVLGLLIFLTQSRGGIIGFGAFAVFALPATSRSGARLRSIAIVALVGASVLMFSPSSVWQRLGGLANVTESSGLRAVDPEGSAQQRWEVWMTAGRVIADHPIFGVGLGAYPAANEEYAPAEGGADLRLGARDTHSTYLNVLAELGPPGLGIFGALVLSVLVRAESVRRRCRLDLPRAARQLYFLELGLLGFLVAGIWASYARIAMLYVHLALIYIVSEAMSREQREVSRMSAPRPAAS